MATAKVELIDQESRELATNDWRHAYCVEAAAGTGKTTLLIDRLITIVRSGAAELKDVVAITFTDKAAAELRARLRKELEIGKQQGEEHDRGRYARALEQLDRANISTIHAFASSLLRERPVEAGIDPGFEQLDEMQSELLFAELWETWKQEQLATPPPGVRRLLELEIDLSRIREIAGKLLVNRDIALLPGVSSTPFAVAEVWNEIEALVQQLDALKGACTDDCDRGFQQIERLVDLVRRTPAAVSDRERAILLDLTVKENAGNQAGWSPPSICRQQKDVCRELKALATDARERLGQSIAADVLNWLRGFLVEVERQKHRRGLLDFQDLLLKARDLLRDHIDVRRYFQQRFRFLLVDEFQDTDPLQAELVFFLAEDDAEAGAAATHWRDVRLAPDKLFLVGDPKQSIYRFRRADMQIYSRAKAMLEGLNPALTIQQNFRSSPWLLRIVNDWFAPQMGGGEFQAEYVNLEPAPGRPNAGPALAILFPPDPYEPASADEYRRTEAELVTRFIQELCRGGNNPVKVWDRNSLEARAPEFGDIAVLFPVSTGLGFYEDAMRSAGIPIQLDAGRQFYSRRETAALLSVLEAVDDPENAIAVVAALRSPFFGLSDEDLFLYHHAHGTFHYLRKPVDGFPRFAAAFGQLSRWHGLRANTPLASLLDIILNESCVLPFYLLHPGGEQTVANLLRIVELARRFEREPGACLRSLSAWLEQRAASTLAENPEPFNDEQENAVRMLSIHTAKGLEFPIVVLVGMACNENNDEAVLIDHGRNEIAISLGSGIKTANFGALALNDGQRGRAEDLRLFYVAATRARDCLVMTGMAPKNCSQARFLGFFQNQLAAYGDKPGHLTPASEDGVLRVRAEDLPEEDFSQSLSNCLRSLTPTDELISPLLTRREAWKRKLEEIGVGVKTEAEEKPMSDRQWQARAHAAALGGAFHRIMQQVELEIADDRELDALVAREAQAQGVSEETVKLKNWVTGTLASSFLQRARAAKQVWRELPFCIHYGGQIVEGSMDLLFSDEDGLALVDYKTEEVSAKEMSEKIESHRDQLTIYREAIRLLTGKHLREVAVYFVRSGVGQSVTF
jgi:ATP-dependent helicase/nuclease subunit A